MRVRTLFFVIGLAISFVIWCGGSGCQSRHLATDASDEQAVSDNRKSRSFSQDVAPIFFEHCARSTGPYGAC